MTIAQQIDPSIAAHLTASRKLAKKYKAMRLDVQRLNAVKDAIFWRKASRS